MSKKPITSAQATARGLTRRNFLKAAGGALLGAVGAYALPRSGRNLLLPADIAEAVGTTPDLSLAGTDGWIYLPPSPAIPPYHPDSLAPAPFTTYMFGFRDVTGMPDDMRFAQKGKTQHPAPPFWVDEDYEFTLELMNLGLALRPDLTDAHTVHWHGFKNQIPYFDGEPSSGPAVPIGRKFLYIFRPHDPGTYMYHCHVEDVEHVHMGMVGVLFVRPKQNGATFEYPVGSGKIYTKFAYNDGDGSTGYDREFSFILSEVWLVSHWSDAHIQLPEWSEYRADFSLLNGRPYPDTLAPAGAGHDPVTGDLIPTPGYEHLQYQPVSSLVQCNSGDRVLIRIANLGFNVQAMTLPGLTFEVVGRDATHFRGRDGTNIYYKTNTLLIGPGEAYDAVFTAPDVPGPGPTTYLFYSRNFGRANNLDGSGYGGQMTEVRIFPAGTLPPQTVPNA